jgi:hypothetical protein
MPAENRKFLSLFFFLFLALCKSLIRYLNIFRKSATTERNSRHYAQFTWTTKSLWTTPVTSRSTTAITKLLHLK